VSEPIIIDASEVCAMLKISTRTLERRHTWQPKFPAPLTRRPLTWTRERIEEWVRKRDALAQRDAA
jgi:predicted DNA-binding transcriptional regulator AlpA